MGITQSAVARLESVVAVGQLICRVSQGGVIDRISAAEREATEADSALSQWRVSERSGGHRIDKAKEGA